MGYKAGMTHVVRDLDRPGSSAYLLFYGFDDI
jgi:ribosomal protein L3